MRKTDYSTWRAGRNAAKLDHLLIAPEGQDLAAGKVVIIDPSTTTPTFVGTPSASDSRVARQTLVVPTLDALDAALAARLTGRSRAHRFVARALSVAERRSGRTAPAAPTFVLA